MKKGDRVIKKGEVRTFGTIIYKCGHSYKVEFDVPPNNFEGGKRSVWTWESCIRPVTKLEEEIMKLDD